MRRVIGLTGPFGSGKGFIAEILKKRGFVYYSLSDVLREEAVKQGVPDTRENLINLGNQLREEYGEAALATLLVEKIKDLEENMIVDSIRNPKEVDTLKGLEGFLLLAVDAYPKLRYTRIIERGRQGDPTDIESLMALDKRDIEIGIYDCVDKADYFIYNVNKTEELLARELTDVIRDKARPNKDEYYWGIALAVAQRGTCLRRRFGAVIVNNDQIVSTGYVGAPRGDPNCIDINKCVRVELNIPRGQQYDICRSVHAEENAIIHPPREQMLGGTIYVACQDLEKPGYPVVKGVPCDLCQRKIKNAGLHRVVTFDAGGQMYEWFVKDWTRKAIEDPFHNIKNPLYK